MIALPADVTLLQPGESLVLKDGRVFAPSPMKGLVLHSDDVDDAVTVMPFIYLAFRETPDGLVPVKMYESEHNPETDLPLQQPKADPDAPEEQWDLALQHALDFLLRVRAER